MPTEVIGEAVVKVLADQSDLNEGLNQAKEAVSSVGEQMQSSLGQSLDVMGKSMKQTGDNMQRVGKEMSIGISAPLAAIGGSALKMSTDFNSAMANVATLIPGNIERVDELRSSILTMSQDTGKNVTDLSDGMYQLISAFGDSAESVNLLEQASRGAVAGLSSTEESVNLLSTVIKGYGLELSQADTVMDKAFTTVKLGQTTFGELANTMGRAVPLASTLGVGMDELFGSVAALTGVTGNTAEVMTQLRATMQAVINPSDAMQASFRGIVSRLIEQGQITGQVSDYFNMYSQMIAKTYAEMRTLEDAGGKSSAQYKQLAKDVKDMEDSQAQLVAGMGPAIVETLGFQEALRQITAAAGGNNAALSDMFGSVESLNAVLALSGPQADKWSESTQAMTQAAGAADEAFSEQAEGVNAAGFAMQQARQEIAAVAIQLGDALMPAFAGAVTAARPLIDALGGLVQWFTDLPQPVQNVAIGITALVAAIGPLLVIAGTLISTWGTVAGALAAAGPILTTVTGAFSVLAAALGPVGVAVVALAAAWRLNVFGIRDATEEAVQAVTGFFRGLADDAERIWNGISKALSGIWQGLSRALTGETEDLAGSVLDKLSDLWGDLERAFDRGTAAVEWVIGLFIDFFSQRTEGLVDYIEELFSGLWSDVTAIFRTAQTTLSNTVQAISNGMTGTFQTAIRNVETAFSGLRTFFGTVWNGIRYVVETAVGGITRAINGLITLAERARTALGRIGEAITGANQRVAQTNFSNVPGTQFGGRVRRSGLVLVGERGPELLSLPRGAEVQPLTGTRAPRLAAAGGEQIVLQQYITAQASPQDLQRYTERALRKVAVQWQIR